MNEATEKKNDTPVNPLAAEPIRKLFVRLVIPSVVAQIVNLLYNMVDRIYIGRIPEIGSLALTGVGICMPLTLILSAFSQLVGVGGAPKASMSLGQQKPKQAEKILGSCTAFLIVLSVLLTVIFLVFSEQWLVLFGASENTLPYALDYMNIYVLGTIFVEISLALNLFITAQGNAKTSMFTVLIGAGCNIILDPIFIFGLNMGVKGAALATIISQGISAVWVVWYLYGKKSTIRLKKESMKLDIRVLAPCLALGLSPFVMAITECLLSICFNQSLLKYGGDMAVGAMAIFATVMQFTTMPAQGIAQGAQSITSFNFGAGNYKRVSENIKLLLKTGLIFSAVMWLSILLLPKLFINIFTNNAELIAYSAKMIRVYFAMLWVLGLQFACQNTFVALGNAKTSLFLALLRKVFLLIPLIYILPQIITGNPVFAVFLAEPVADTIAAAATTMLFMKSYGKILFNKGGSAEQ